MRDPVHIITMTSPLGDPMVIVPTTLRSWISRAVIDRIPECARRWCATLPAWSVDFDERQLLTDVVEEAGGGWCDDCVNWLLDPTATMCKVWIPMAGELAELGCDIVHPGKEEDPVAENGGFKMPPALKALIVEEAGALFAVIAPHLKNRARTALGKQAASMGMHLSDAALDEFFEALYNAARGTGAAPAVTRMNAMEAAAVLGIKWPCTADEVLKAYRIQARRTHPDHGGDAEAFKRVVSARTALMEAL